MNIQPPNPQRRRAMTLFEVLAVIIVVLILAGLLLPATTGHKPAYIKMALLEMRAISAAIASYEGAYNHLPLDDSNTNDDATFGIDSADLKRFQRVSGTRLVTSNSDLMIILMDVDRGVNAGHKMNTNQFRFIEPKMAKNASDPGVSITDYEYRDPWGKPYIISLDANHDERTRDAFYASPTVCSNVSALTQTSNTGLYEFSGSIMIWSRGPDGKADMNSPANAGVNKDNVLSW